MYSAPIPASSSLNAMGGSMIDGSGTIDPAALNTPVSGLPATSAATTNAPIGPRGQKRSRTPEQTGDAFGGGAEDDDQKPKKRGRPPKSKLSDEGPASPPSQQVARSSPDQLRTPQLQSQGLPQDVNSTPTSTSPPKATPTKSTIKALPTVRDHTTDQLNYEQDEYMPRETDEAGEQKVSKTGMPLGNRQFKIRTFYVAHRGEKRFMLATECARVLGYRDSYLLFNKNRSLHKIIASQQEKDELIHQEILPYSYRSRQIAIVTAKSMFRQFGARVIEGGRRVRDDYWEAKAIKQGFTEDDMAGDKRPGASKARDAAAALAENPPINPGNPESHQEIIYSDATMGNLNPSHGPPGILWPQINSEDSRLRAYGSVQRPRQGITGAPYQDRTQTTPVGDVLHQATNAAELNKTVAQQRGIRNKLQTDHWNRERESPVPTPRQKVDQSPIVTHSPHLPSSTIMNTGHQSMLQHQTSQMMSPQQAYSHQQSHQQNLPAQPPARGGIHTRSSISSYSSGHAPNPSPYSGYHHQQPPLWGHPPPHPQPQQSPLSAHHPGLPHYSPSTHHQQPPQVEHHPPQSPHSQPQQQQQQQQLQLQQQQHHPHHHQQQQEEGQPQQQPPQLPHNQSSGTMHAGITYQTMAGMPSGPSGYSQPGAMAGVRSMYPPHSGSPSHQQYLQQHQTTAAPQAGMQGWAPPQQQQQQQQGQQQGQQGWQQGYPASSAY